jgi:hypothetical protein
VKHFETALAMNERMRAPALVARTQVEMARALAQVPGGRDRAAELLEAGSAEARQLGLPRLVEAAGAAVSG